MVYTGKATRTGNSRGFRFSSALFQSHPEFSEGDVDATVIAPGRLLVRTRDAASDGADEDPVFEAFLAFMEDQLVKRPDLLRPLTVGDVDGLDELLAGVEFDPDAALGASDERL